MRVIVAVGILQALMLAACQGADSDGGLSPDSTAQQEGSTVSSDPVRYEAYGVVTSITPSRTYMNVAHGDINGFMEAMTMLFPVADTTVLQDVSPNDSIRFVLTVDGNVFVSEVEVIE